jgi:hypothetical protein
MASLTPCPHYIGKGMPSWCLLGACAQPETQRLRQKMSRSFADWMLASPGLLCAASYGRLTLD